MMMVYGNNKLIKELKAKVVNTMVDENGYDMTLYSIEDTTVETDSNDRFMVFYEAIDPSKNEKIVLRVPPMFKDKTAIEAKYWTFPELWEEYNK
jgi:NADH:ubiquinone oxidoreductase subunit C